MIMLMGLDSISLFMAQRILENGNMTRKMAQGLKCGQMELSMMGGIRME